MAESFFIKFSLFRRTYIVEVTKKNVGFQFSTFIDQFGTISKPVESKSIKVNDSQGREFTIELEINLEEYSEFNKVKAYYINFDRGKTYIEFVKYSYDNPLGYNYKHQFLIKDYLLRLLKSAKINASPYDLQMERHRDDTIGEIQLQLAYTEQLYFETYLPSSKMNYPNGVWQLAEVSHIDPNICCKLNLDELEYFSDDGIENEGLSSAFLRLLFSANQSLKIFKLSPIRGLEISSTDFYKLQGIVLSRSIRKTLLGYIRTSFWQNDTEVIFNFNKEELDTLIEIIEAKESDVTDFTSCQPLQWCIEQMEHKAFYGDLNQEMSEEIQRWLKENSIDHYGYDYMHKKLEIYHEEDDHRMMFVFAATYITIDYASNGNINCIVKSPRRGFFEADLPEYRED